MAFHSEASNLVPGDTNGVDDVFVHDRETGTTERVSVGVNGEQGNDRSAEPFIGADGRYVAFHAGASNLVAGDTNGAPDVFVHDRETGTTERVSVGIDGAQGNSSSNYPSLSADGRYVAFFSAASNLVPGDTNGISDVFVRDRETGITERMSVASDGTEGNNFSFYSAISADGRYVAFESDASNLVPGDTNGISDVFVRDRETGITERMSVGPDGAEGNDTSAVPSVSGNGRYVAFYSRSSNLVPQDTNGGFAWDVFVRDRVIGTTERVPVGSDGGEGNDGSSNFSMSRDGRYFAFYSFASNLVPGDTNGAPDVFVHDRQTGATERVSLGADAVQGNEWSFGPSISADGRSIAFYSRASNLVPADTNGASDIFARDRGPAGGVGGLSAVAEGDRISVSGGATFSGRVLGSATDPPDDGGPGAAEDAELIGASITYRPEQEDLLVRLDLSSLRGERCGVVVCEGGGGAPGVLAPGLAHRRALYGVGFELEGTRYEVRARSGSFVRTPAGTESDDPYFALYRCDSGCAEEAVLTGGIGTTGTEVRASVPLSVLGAGEGENLTAIRASTSREAGAIDAQQVLDQVDIPDVTIPDARVSVGVAPAGTPPEDVTFSVEAMLTEGTFSSSVEISSLPAGQYEVWARGCLGAECGSMAMPISLG